LPSDLVARFILSPTRLGQDNAGIITFGEEVGLFLDGDTLTLRLGGDEARAAFPVELGVWHHITMSFDPGGGRIRLAVSALGRPISVSEAATDRQMVIDPTTFRVAAVAGHRPGMERPLS
jgi:hypothetical protein